MLTFRDMIVTEHFHRSFPKSSQAFLGVAQGGSGWLLPAPSQALPSSSPILPVQTLSLHRQMEGLIGRMD